MKKYLLFAFMLSVLIANAQPNNTDQNCRAAFKYAINDSIMTLMDATAINFYDRSEGNVMLWFWDFGDGITSNEQNPMHIFSDPLMGTSAKMNPYRTVNLTVLTYDSCKSFYSETINIMPEGPADTLSCMARFKYYQTAYDSVGKTASFQLTNLSAGDSLQYTWLFDDGKISTEKEPVVTFDFSRPDRKVCLTVNGKNNCTDTFCDAVYVYDPGKIVIGPYDPDSIKCETAFGYSVNYTVKTLAPALVLDFYSKAWPEPVEWAWDFGDGTTSNEANPTHIFNFPLANDSLFGTKELFRKVCLTVKTATGCIASTCQSIDIYNVFPKTGYYMHVESGFPVEMSSCAGWAKAQVYQGDTPVNADNYVWSTGDEGQEVKGLCPTHSYSVKAVAPDGSVVSETFVLNLNGPDTAKCYTAFGYKINYDIKTLLPSLVLDFYAKETPGAVEWTWDFGDGTTSNEANPTHIFNFPQTNDNLIGMPNPFMNVCLKVKHADGCEAMSCQTINIYMETTPVEPDKQCHAWFKYEKALDVVTIPEVVAYQLKDVSEGKVIRRLWQFENGDTSTVPAPLVTFDIFKPTQKVCLTIYTADSCSSTWCETINVSNNTPPDSSYYKPANNYSFHYESYFPEYVSSCQGWVKAQVYLNDSVLVNATDYGWSTGEMGQEVKGLCPTQIYTVKAIAPDGTYVTGSFVFNSNGPVTEVSFNWRFAGINNNPYIRYALDKKVYSVEWILCDGSVVKSDSILFSSINCGGNASNMILKDASGNILYSGNISLNSFTVNTLPDVVAASPIKLFPNPVKDVLNIQYSGKLLKEMQLEICDITGRLISQHKFSNISSGQNLSLNVNSLLKGTYLCKMVSDKQVIQIGKFIK